MPSDWSRLSIRRWSILVAILSGFLGACHWAEGWRPLFRHASANADYELVRQRYEEGRLTCDRLVEASRNLLNAQLELAEKRQARISAIKAHLRRVDAVLQFERNDLYSRSCRGGCSDLAEAEQMREDDEALLNQSKRWNRQDAK